MNKNTFRWLFAALVFKLVLFLLFVNAMHSYWPKEDVVKSICFIGNDTKSYYEPLDRLMNGEGYSYQKSSSTSETGWEIAPMGYRLPGLLPVYCPLYYFFGNSWAKFIVILLQLIAEIFSVYLLAKSAAILFKTPTSFLLTLILYSLNTVVSVYTAFAYSESFCISFFIFSFYFLLRFGNSQKLNYLFLSGLFLCWSMFFRPVIVIFLPFYFITILYYLYQQNNFRFLSAFRSMLVFAVVFIFAESVWITRNYKVFNRFIPLYSGFDSYNSKQEMALFKLIIAWGGDIQDWNPSEGRWFVVPSDSKARVYDRDFQNTNPFRQNIFTPDYNLDSLKILRSEYWQALGYSETGDSVDKDHAMAKFSSRINRYYESFKHNHPFDFYVISKLRHLRTFVCIQRPYAFPFIKQNLFQKSLRVASVLFYYFIIIAGSLGMLLALKNKSLKVIWIIALGTWSFIFIHAYMGLTEFRYLLPTYPIFTVLATYTLLLFVERRRNRQSVSVRS